MHLRIIRGLAWAGTIFQPSFLFCKDVENNYGMLAVRRQNFISRDDDFDVIVGWADYEKLVHILQNHPLLMMRKIYIDNYMMPPEEKERFPHNLFYLDYFCIQ